MSGVSCPTSQPKVPEADGDLDSVTSVWRVKQGQLGFRRDDGTDPKWNLRGLLVCRRDLELMQAKFRWQSCVISIWQWNREPQDVHPEKEAAVRPHLSKPERKQVRMT